MKKEKRTAAKERPEKQLVEITPEETEKLRGGITSRHCSAPRELLCGHERGGQGLPD